MRKEAFLLKCTEGSKIMRYAKFSSCAAHLMRYSNNTI